MLYLPSNGWICKECKQEWFEYFGEHEIPTCVICESENIKENNVEEE
jgi:hypothetical protein